ncbi:MAG: hypothetical protein P8185_17035 [Deltaproteobacteria bacterium]
MAKLVRLSKPIADAILAVLRYVRDMTGDEPTQEEIANALKSYFILNEIGNQIKYQRKKRILAEPLQTVSPEPFWTLNLLAGPPKNSLVRVGLFYQNVLDAILTVRRFVKNGSGNKPSETEIAHSLRSTFIISEIKNHIDWQRNGLQKAKKPVSLTK